MFALNFCQFLSKTISKCALVRFLIGPLINTTKSNPLNRFCFILKLSLIILFMRLRLTELCICRFGTARPKRGQPQLFFLAKKTNCLSTVRCPEEKMSWKASLLFNLLFARQKAPGLKRDTIFQTKGHISGGQSFSSFITSRLDNKPARSSLHTSPEAVVSFSLQFTGLICLFHGSKPYVALLKGRIWYCCCYKKVNYIRRIFSIL